ncbi:transcriptional antiterminator RfaH [Roseiarcus fermentans]|uniref:Transcriptional antiterminator RfaH n=2 Tax=Roseiarcus fermentans TaxID=1473586 RepID=A0A366EY68_9HYPH|nr:transcriptional antiterminator RfaH [Roseiarcus fermentans]
MQLRAQDLRVFLPFVRASVRHARRTRDVCRAAFPGYLFVALDLDRDRWRSINGTIGVLRLIMGENGPLPVPAGVVETLFGYLDETGACRFDRDLVTGQSVRVASGPLAQAMGRLVRLDSRGKVRVLLEILGGQIYATLDRANLEAV